MIFSLAPMEGITGYIIRGAYAHHFNHIDKYYTPFIPAAKRMSSKIRRDIDPENNKDCLLIPQLISNSAEEIIQMQKQLQDYGYHQINLNLGCPSGTVVSKKRGSGLLAYPKELDAMLDELFSKATFPISIKTRIGFSSPEEWETLLDIYRKYPMSELIIHPRTRADLYGNHPNIEAYKMAKEALRGTNIPVVYNGDIVDLESYRNLLSSCPDVSEIMIGRGLLQNPALTMELSGEVLPHPMETLRSFHDEILEGYQADFSGDKNVLMHMKQLFCYLVKSFPVERYPDIQRLEKKIKKSQTLKEYKLLISQLF